MQELIHKYLLSAKNRYLKMARCIIETFSIITSIPKNENCYKSKNKKQFVISLSFILCTVISVLEFVGTCQNKKEAIEKKIQI